MSPLGDHVMVPSTRRGRAGSSLRAPEGKDAVVEDEEVALAIPSHGAPAVAAP